MNSSVVKMKQMSMSENDDAIYETYTVTSESAVTDGACSSTEADCKQ